MKNIRRQFNTSFFIYLMLALMVTSFLTYYKIKKDIVKINPKKPINVVDIQQTSPPTPTKPVGIGYDPKTYPVETYINDEFGFNFDYQKGVIRKDILDGKELLDVDLFVCAGACSVRASITVLPFDNLEEALDYRLNNESLVKEINLKYLNTTSSELNGYPSRIVTYDISGFKYYDVIATKGNYSFSIFGTQALDVAEVFRFD